MQTTISQLRVDNPSVTLAGDELFVIDKGSATLAATLDEIKAFVQPDEASGGAAGLMSPDEKTKLEGIEALATKNAPDSTLQNRANHTGAQAISTVTGLGPALSSLEESVENLEDWQETVDGTLGSIGLWTGAIDLWQSGINTWKETVVDPVITEVGVKFPAYTLATLPDAAANAGVCIEVTDATSFPTICRSNGTDWKILNTDVTVS